MATILVADDEENFRDLLEMILNSLGHTYAGASTGVEALAYLESKPVDLFLCDLIMGEMSGIETMQRARDLCPDLKIVAVSGAAAFARQAGTGLPLGAHAMVSKPFKIEQLTKTINTLLAISGPAANIRPHPEQGKQ